MDTGAILIYNSINIQILWNITDTMVSDRLYNLAIFRPIFILLMLGSCVAEAHMCFLQKRYDVLAGKMRWSLGKRERCLCQGVAILSRNSKVCQQSGNGIDEDYWWFVDDQSALIDRRNWNQVMFDNLLDLGIDRQQCDFEDPTIFCSANILEEAAVGENSTAVDWIEPNATDNSGKPPTVKCSHVSGSTFEIGGTDIVCVARDLNGNNASCSFIVDVIGSEDPKISCPVHITKKAAVGVNSAVVDWNPPISTDNSGKPPTVTCSHVSGSTFEIGGTDIVCVARDLNGNNASCSFIVDVKATCSPECVNEGVCEYPNKCSCPACYGGDRCESVIPGTSAPLGVSNEEIIADSQMTAVNQFHADKHPGNGRLHNPDQFWAPMADTSKPWLQVDFLKLVVVTGVQTQGAVGLAQYVKEVQIKYGDNVDELQFILQDGSPKTFIANDNEVDVKQIDFSGSYVTRYIRIIVTAFEWWPALRIEVLGYECT